MNQKQRAGKSERCKKSLQNFSEMILKERNESDWLQETTNLLQALEYLNENSEIDDMLQTLTSAAKSKRTIRKQLLENNIFQRLSVHLSDDLLVHKPETIMKLMIFIMVLVTGNTTAQTLVQESGCLIKLSAVLSLALDKLDESPTTSGKDIDIIISAVIVCVQYPRQAINQTVVGWIIPKVIDFFNKDMNAIFVNSSISKYLWSFLRYILDRNLQNIQIFIEASGSTVLFKTLDLLTEDDDDDNNIYKNDMLRRVTGVLRTLSQHQAFLQKVAIPRRVILLWRLLKIDNVYVVRNITMLISVLNRLIPEMQEWLCDEESVQILKSAVLCLTRRTDSHIYRKCEEIGREEVIRMQTLLLQLIPFNTQRNTAEIGISNFSEKSMFSSNSTSSSSASSEKTSAKKEKNDSYVHKITNPQFHRLRLRTKEKNLRATIECLRKRHELQMEKATKTFRPTKFAFRNLIMTPFVLLKKYLSTFSRTQTTAARGEIAAT